MPRAELREIEDFPDELERNYHRVDGYSLKDKLEGSARACRTLLGPISCSRSRTTSSCSAGATPSGQASRRSSRRTSPSRRSRRTRSDTRGRCTGSWRRSSAPTSTPSRSTATGGVPLRAAGRAAATGVGSDDRPALPVRDGRRRADRGPARVRRRARGRPGGEDRPRGGLPPHPRGHVARPACWRARRVAPGWRRRSASCGRTRSGCSTPSCARCGRSGCVRGCRSACPTPSRSRAAPLDELQELWEEMTMVRRSQPAGRDGDERAGLGRARRDRGSGDPGHLDRRPGRDPRRPRGDRARADRAHAHVPGLPGPRRHAGAIVRKEELGAEAAVDVVLDDSWSTDRITPAGREKLRRAGFAPPAPASGRRRLVQLQSRAFRCPYCGSTDTTLENIFGPTPCRRSATASCRAFRAVQDDLAPQVASRVVGRIAGGELGR